MEGEIYSAIHFLLGRAQGALNVCSTHVEKQSLPRQVVSTPVCFSCTVQSPPLPSFLTCISKTDIPELEKTENQTKDLSQRNMLMIFCQMFEQVKTQKPQNTKFPPFFASLKKPPVRVNKAINVWLGVKYNFPILMH